MSEEILKNRRWQAPGNAKGFDSALGNSSKMNNRTIGILSYIKKQSVEDGFVNRKKYEEEILEYLVSFFDADKNNSTKTHFYQPALFYGFIQKNSDNLLLSIEGNLFLNSYQNKDFNNCKKLIINQLDNTTYPNQSTTRVKGLKLFPFRILFKLLLDQNSLSIEFLKKELVYIYEYKNLELYEKNLNLNFIKEATSIEGSREKKEYDKFYTWVINSLVDLKILDNENRSIVIHKDAKKHIEMLYKNLNFQDMFFNDSTCELNQNIAKKRVKRDASLIVKAKQRDNYLCSIDKAHITFISKNNNYTEGHHIIPMFQQKNFDFELDDVENIASLCPNCHREIHSSDNKMPILSKLYNRNKEYMDKKNISLHELYSMYLCI